MARMMDHHAGRLAAFVTGTRRWFDACRVVSSNDMAQVERVPTKV
jgi:hypothetical protein